MAQWTDALKEQAKQMYQEGNPTAENSAELLKQIAEELDMTPNGVRMVLVTAGVYVKKEPTSGSASKAAASGSEGTKRVSKEVQLAALKAALVDNGATIDDEILDKLTGKAAAYLAECIRTIVAAK